MVHTTYTFYGYNAQGIRTAKKTPDGQRTAFLLDGGNVVGEVQNNTVTQNYLRGINLIRREAGTATDYYLFNAHGDVVDLVNTASLRNSKTNSLSTMQQVLDYARKLENNLTFRSTFRDGVILCVLQKTCGLN